MAQFVFISKRGQDADLTRLWRIDDLEIERAFDAVGAAHGHDDDALTAVGCQMEHEMRRRTVVVGNLAGVAFNEPAGAIVVVPSGKFAAETLGRARLAVRIADEAAQWGGVVDVLR